MTIFHRRREFGQVESVGDNIDDGELGIGCSTDSKEFPITGSKDGLGYTAIYGVSCHKGESTRSNKNHRPSQ